jgi:hypothetical protein
MPIGAIVEETKATQVPLLRAVVEEEATIKVISVVAMGGLVTATTRASSPTSKAQEAT